MNSAGIRLEEVSHTYSSESGDTLAVDNVDLDIDSGEIFCVVGPSGCGKSTLLQLIAGLETPSTGRVLVAEKQVTQPGPDRGVVFQQYALFPWMTVGENVGFGLKLQGVPREARRLEVETWVDRVGLSEFIDRYPKELSGGMKQRTALARAYAASPRVLLMDEPFGALDAQTRGKLQEQLLATWEREQTTVFFITHDVDEAVFLGSRVAIMSRRPGRIREIVEVGLERPRREEIKMSGEFTAIKRHIWEAVREEYESTD